jgi:hypothetical protein
MRRYRTLLLAALLIGPASYAYVKPKQGGKPFKDAPHGKAVMMNIWNQTGRDVRVKITLDGWLLYNSTVKRSNHSPAIMVTQKHRVRAGKHRVILYDLSRGLQLSKAFQVKDKTRIEVWLNPKGSGQKSGIEIGYGDVMYAQRYLGVKREFALTE